MQPFNEWQAGRRHVPDLSAEIDDDCVSGPGYVYSGQFYINDNADPTLGGKHRLHLERDEYFTDDLQSLEQRLYDWIKPHEEGTDAMRTPATILAQLNALSIVSAEALGFLTQELEERKTSGNGEDFAALEGLVNQLRKTLKEIAS